MMALIFITFQFIFVTAFFSTAAEIRPWDTFERLVPDLLRSNFDSQGCLSMEDAGQRGLCELLSATGRQIQILETSSKHNISSSPQEKSPSCKYKQQDGASLHRYATQPSPGLQDLLQKYTQMHRLCVREEYSNLGEHIHRPSSSPRCRYIVWSCTFGLGNRLMSLVSAFLYALLSQRVLLVDNPGWDILFCQPFPDSNWLFPQKTSMPRIFQGSFSNFYDGKRSPHPKVVPVSFTSTTKPSEHRFLVCPAALKSVRDVPFLYFQNSNQYYAPGFFLNPALRPVLEVLFPDKRIFHSLGRFLLNPSDSVWDRVARIHDSSLKDAGRRFGVQLREFSGRYTSYFDVTVPLCIRSKLGICPIEDSDSNLNSGGNEDSNSGGSSNSTVMSVYIASMVQGHEGNITSSLKTLENDFPRIRFATRSQQADGEQMDDPGHQQKALVDIWLLSLSDVLLTTQLSTFGYTAQALGGITPLRITHWPRDPCFYGVSSDPCFHFPPAKGFKCQDDGDNFSVDMDRSRGLNYAWECHDLKSGMQFSE